MTQRHNFIFDLAISPLLMAIWVQIATAQPHSPEHLGESILEIKSTYAAAIDAEGRDRLEMLRRVRDASHAIVENYSESPEAAAILLDRKIDGVDLSEVASEIASLSRNLLDQRLEVLGMTYDQIGAAAIAAPTSLENDVPETTSGVSFLNSPSNVATPEAPGSASLPNPAQATSQENREVAFLEPTPPVEERETSDNIREASLSTPPDYSGLSKKEVIRRTQMAFNDVGCDAGDPDGVVGRKTRLAHERLSAEKEIDPSVFQLGSHELLGFLEGLTETVCQPLPEIQLTASNMAGQWSFRSRCGANARPKNTTITGALSVRHSGGGTYVGKIRNSNGFNGEISFKLAGRNVKGSINWGLLVGRTGFNGSVAKDALVLYGRDTHGCRITARKR